VVIVSFMNQSTNTAGRSISRTTSANSERLRSNDNRTRDHVIGTCIST
jgi:hypothetical protein